MEDELLQSIVRIISAGLEVCNDDGANVSKHGESFNLQFADRGCVEYETAEEAAREFLGLVRP